MVIIGDFFLLIDFDKSYSESHANIQYDALVLCRKKMPNSINTCFTFSFILWQSTVSKRLNIFMINLFHTKIDMLSVHLKPRKATLYERKTTRNCLAYNYDFLK